MSKILKVKARQVFDIEETKDESVVETEAPKQETDTTEQDKTFENERETKLEEKKRRR